jgi:hypothetical protein
LHCAQNTGGKDSNYFGAGMFRSFMSPLTKAWAHLISGLLERLPLNSVALWTGNTTLDSQIICNGLQPPDFIVRGGCHDQTPLSSGKCERATVTGLQHSNRNSLILLMSFQGLMILVYNWFTTSLLPMQGIDHVQNQ